MSSGNYEESGYNLGVDQSSICLNLMRDTTPLLIDVIFAINRLYNQKHLFQHYQPQTACV